VTTDGPYKRKLALLAERSITKHNKTSSNRFGTTRRSRERLVCHVWQNVRYAWRSASHGLVTRDQACAFTWKSDIDGNGNLPLIVFCEKFAVVKSKREQEGFLATDKGQKVALLFFFRKIKHEFLHSVQRYLEIKYEVDMVSLQTLYHHIKEVVNLTLAIMMKKRTQQETYSVYTITKNLKQNPLVLSVLYLKTR